jgi:hypothetical protein
MKRFVLGILLGALAAAWCVWHFVGQPQPPSLKAEENWVSNSQSMARTKLKELGLTPENIRNELDRTGKVIRNKSEAVGHALADATADARITADIKGKFLADRDLSSLSISVNTTAACVTLSGTASTPENIIKAMSLAYDTEGVNQVISTLQVKQ